MSTTSRPPAPAAPGFTLLEMLVTLVVVSMIVVVLMQALQQALSLRTRVQRFDAQSRASLLQESWFRDSVRAAIPDLPDAMGSPEGSPQRFEFITAAPLTGSGLARIAWTLRPVDGGHALDYTAEDGTRLAVLPGPLKDAAFTYLDPLGEWHGEWTRDIALPVQDRKARPGDPEEAVPLPRMVRLTANDGALSWLVPVISEPQPPAMLRPADFGMRL